MKDALRQQTVGSCSCSRPRQSSALPALSSFSSAARHSCPVPPSARPKAVVAHRGSRASSASCLGRPAVTVRRLCLPQVLDTLPLVVNQSASDWQGSLQCPLRQSVSGNVGAMPVEGLPSQDLAPCCQFRDTSAPRPSKGPSVHRAQPKIPRGRRSLPSGASPLKQGLEVV